MSPIKNQHHSAPKYPIFLLIICLFTLLISCTKKQISEEDQFAEKASKVGLSEEESRALYRQMALDDSLKPLFCQIILDKDLTNEEKLEKSDDLLAAGLSTDFNCKVNYSRRSPTPLRDLGNKILPGSPFGASG